MTEFPGFPSNGIDFHYEELGAALAGLIVRDGAGVPRPGVLPCRETLVTAGSGWTLNVAPFVAVRADGRKVLIGGTDEALQVTVAPAPSANARIDVVYSLPANVDAGDPIEAVAVRQGTAATAPVKPSIPAGAVELATFRVPAGAASAAGATITNTFPFTVAAGGRLTVRTRNEMNAWSAGDGASAYCLADKRVYERRNGAWVSAHPVSGRATLANLPANSARELTVSFPTGSFVSPPRVIPTLNAPVAWTPQPTVRVLSVEANRFTLQFQSAVARTSVLVDWVAIPE
ncbi:hypothetical protein [Leucobacter sp. NPDC077196]|uniref:hypothetical protein n=1 Tax=Leucobacter sp. NPDC077196 TaxID=3154959 RepID=UPI00341FA115